MFWYYLIFWNQTSTKSLLDPNSELFVKKFSHIRIPILVKRWIRITTRVVNLELGCGSSFCKLWLWQPCSLAILVTQDKPRYPISFLQICHEVWRIKTNDFPKCLTFSTNLAKFTWNWAESLPAREATEYTYIYILYSISFRLLIAEL